LRTFIVIKAIRESPEQFEEKDSDEEKSGRIIEYLFSEASYKNRIEELEGSEIQEKKNKGNADLDPEKKIMQEFKTKKIKITKLIEFSK
jgi:hypothetical protein